ncbi:MAG: P-loop NTPase fold protein [Xanthomonadales bacterium]|nr:P-loop NTPase fold protein [Xanthomonadales bacterium]
MNDVTLREAPLRFTSNLDEGDEARKTDTLNLLPYAEAMRDFIHDCETPLSIGIQGEWGIGRTSLMNMLRGSGDGQQSGLLDLSLCKTIGLDSWPYAQFDQNDNMAVACLYALTQELGQVLEQVPDVNAAELKLQLEAVNHRLVTVMQQIRELAQGNSGTIKNESPYVDVSGQMLIFKTEFEHLVSLWTQTGQGRRVVIFIDDLDRIRPAMALELLEAIKNFIDVPGCVFVMTLDYEAVQRGMIEKLGQDLQKTSGKAFFDKMIQLPFVVPTTSYDLDEYIIDLLNKAGLPCIDKDGCDPASRLFFLDITRFTVGRNPRGIKRVVNYMNLLERIHSHNAGRETTEKECKILFALVSMQVAWPELFQYFIRDTSVGSVTSLQSWKFLETLPEARSLFERSPDKDLVKNAISAYFDTLFSLLDENDDGQVDSKELGPVMRVMELAKMTNIESRERPRAWIVRRIHENNVDSSPLIVTFLENVFMKSIWYLGTEIRYHRAGPRYVTLVHNRCQIGTIVSLKSQPFVFRLAMSPERVMNGLKDYWTSKQTLKKEAIVLVRNTFGTEASLTGYGDTLVDFSKMTYMASKDAIKLLNALYQIVTDSKK